MPLAAPAIPVRPARPFLLPPPLFFGLSFAAAILLQQAIPLGFPDFPGRTAAGLVLLVIGVVGGPALAATFLARHTTLNPFADASALLTDGPYRLSRNPMYVGLVAAYLGGSLLAASIWPLPLLLLPLAIMDRIVIPYEEASLRRRFGAAYDAYAARVRRWL